MTLQQLRYLIAVAEYDGRNEAENGAFSDLIFVALIAIRDRLRPDAADAVATARRAGIQTVMITGDNPLTAEAIAREFPQVEITFCVRGGPTLNDATREDAEIAGIRFPELKRTAQHNHHQNQAASRSQPCLAASFKITIESTDT